jgi:hypothetical protein
MRAKGGGVFARATTSAGEEKEGGKGVAYQMEPVENTRADSLIVD